MSLTLTTTACDICEAQTTNTVADNDFTEEVLCALCLELTEWEFEHRPNECVDAPPGAECYRDHKEEEAIDRAERADEMRRENQWI